MKLAARLDLSSPSGVTHADGCCVSSHPFVIRLALILSLAIVGGPMLSAQETQDNIEGEPEEHEHQVFVSEPDGSRMRILTQLPDGAFQGSSEWSGDGKRIAFDVKRPKLGETTLAHAKIVVVNSDGTEPRLIGDGVMPTFSPKGNRIAYSRVGKGVWVFDLGQLNSQPELIDLEGWGTAWSPDGSRIAYAKRGNLVVYDLIEGTKQMLFDNNNSPYRYIKWNFAWSSDASKIAFQGLLNDETTTLSIVDARGVEFGHAVRKVGEFEPAICWRPDGNQILFVANCPERNNLRQIYSIDPNGTAPPQLLPQQAANRSMLDVSFSPDGTKLAFSASKPKPKP
ncbi:MAG: hypothetical protein ACKVT0_14345 [Planctomycetaceae bacterium]